MIEQPTFECITCKACGCGVNLYSINRERVLRSTFEKHPIPLYCERHIPVKPIIELNNIQKRNL